MHVYIYHLIASIMVGYLVKCRKSQLQASRVNYIVDRSRFALKYIHMYVRASSSSLVATLIQYTREATSVYM